MAWPDTYTAVDSGDRVASADMNVIRQMLAGYLWYNLAAYGDLSTGTGFGNAIDAAFTAIAASGKPSILEIPPHPEADGLWTDSVGNHIAPLNVTIRGPGSEACVIHHTANNTWMTAVGAEADLLTVRWQFRGFTLRGNAGNSQRALVIGNTYRNKCEDVVFEGYSLTWAVELVNSVQWTEGMLFIECHWRGNLKNVILVQSGTGTNSWAELRFLACNMVLNVANSIGVDVQHSGADLYGGIWDIKFNTEAEDVICVKLADNVRMHDVHLTMMAEKLGSVTQAYGWSFGSGATVEATGFAHFVDHDDQGSGSLTIGAGSQDAWGLGSGHYGVKVGTKTVSADGNVTLLRGASSFHGIVDITFIGPSRVHRQTWWVGYEQFSDTPQFHLIGEYVFGGNAVLGMPYVALLSADSSNPHLRIPVSNRNGGTSLRVTVRTDGQFMNNLLVLPSTDAGTLAEPYRGLKFGPSPVFNVKLYGAKGDGTTDDTAAIQSAIDACGLTPGGIVFFPAGRYVITSSLSVPSFVRLQGVGVPWRSSEITGGDPTIGRGSAILIGGAANFHMIVNEDPTNGNTSIVIEGLELDQRTASGDVDIIRFRKVWRSQVRDCYFRGDATTNRRGLHMREGSEQMRCERNFLEGCGIYTENSNAMFLYKNDIGAAKYGISHGGGFGSHIEANHIYNSSENQMLFTNSNGLTIVHNHMEDGDKHGIAASSGLKNSAIHGNVIKKNGKSAAGVYSGIILDSDVPATPSEYNSIRGNHVYDDHGTPTQGYGISLVSFSGSQTNNNIVEGNVLWGNTVAQLDEAAGLSNVIGEQVGWGTGTATWNPASVAAGAQTTTTVTVTGAKLGDRVDVSFSLDLQGQQLTGYVSAANTVTAVLRNGTAGAIDLASGTLRARIRRG